VGFFICGKFEAGAFSYLCFMQHPIQTVSIIGAGNVATHLAQALADQGCKILSVTSKNGTSAQQLAAVLGAEMITDISQIPTVDLVLVCVNDDEIAGTIQQIPAEYAVAYTSGSVELSSIGSRENCGVFYPLQTFSKNRQLDLFEVPFFIEANDTDFAQQLFDLAWKISRKVYFATSETRKQLHVGAVLVNNFTNHLAYLASEHFAQHALDFAHLQPLLQETVAKLTNTNPFDAQTGPARRNDQQTIDAHLALLQGMAKQIYTDISKSIQQTYTPET
jgi:predicted short-subunit dehydrogenase-like oxidoreductase (DUF2520 family)